MELASTVSGSSHLKVKLRTAQGNSSTFEQTQYFDEIEQIMRRKKRQKEKQARQFLHTLEQTQQQALAQKILMESLKSNQAPEESL